MAAYIQAFGHLPSNFIKKSQAEAAGWSGSGGDSLWKYPGLNGKSIGGDSFGNREGILPKKSGRKYYECDIDYNGKSRGTKRIVYSNDGLIFYTEDHYNTYKQYKNGSWVSYP